MTKLIKKIDVEIRKCDICGITWQQYIKKYPKLARGYAGFPSAEYVVVGWLDICYNCQKINEKYKNSEDWKDNPVQKIIDKLIEIKRLQKRIVKEKME